MLDELNCFTRDGPVHVHDKAGEFAYSDGQDVERYLKGVLENATDLSSTSVELAAAIQDWPTEYHLSSRRANLLRGLDLPAGGRVLEVGCGCGAITRYLGEQGLVVDAIEGSGVRAELAHLRCRDLPNVNIYRGNFNELTLPEAGYDVACLIGVAEYAARFIGDQGSDQAGAEQRPVVALLERVRRAVKPGGMVLIAIENRAGLKYMLGAHEDHYVQRFVGIHNYFGRHDVNTYSLSEWRGIFAETDLTAQAIYLPFPDYKLPTVLLSQGYVNANPGAFCHLEGIESRDYVDWFNPGVRESLLWQAVSAGAAMDRLANSFLFVASPSGPAAGPGESWDFVHLPGFGRRREYCLVTRKRRGEDIVRRQRISEARVEDGWLGQRVVDEPYHAGMLLCVEWARALEIEPDGERFIALVRDYLSFLRQRDEISIDLTPSNIIVDADGLYHAFDEEWQLNETLDAEFLLFRSLLVFVVKSKQAVRAHAHRAALRTVEEFVVRTAALVDIDLSKRLLEFMDREERFQNAIALQERQDLTRHLLETRLDLRMIEPSSDVRFVQPSSIKTRLYWKLPGGLYSVNRCRIEHLDISDQSQKLVYRLPPEAGKASHIRFAPCDSHRSQGVGFMRLYRATIRAVAPENGERSTVWSLDTPETIDRYSEKSGIRHGESKLGSVFMVTDDDPWLEFRFVPRSRLSGDEYLEVEFDLTMPYSREYLLAREQHLIEADRLAAKRRDLERVQETQRRVTRKLEQIEGTRFWTLFLRYARWRRRLAAISVKLERWRALFRTQGYRRGLARLGRSLANHALRSAGREPAVSGPPTRYELWRDTYLRRDTRRLAGGPLISIVMPVYNAEKAILEKAIRSVKRQVYRNWELCIADDASTSVATRQVLERINDKRVKVRFLENNLNISGATNAAASMASGEYLAFMDNDDELADDALNAVAAALVDQPAAELLYSDEDFIRVDGHLDDPHFKTDYNPDLLLSHNYITHLLVMSRALFDRIGGLRGEYDGAQDYDLVLRGVEQAERIVHLPKPVYHWRKSAGSTSLDPLAKRGGHDNARKALGAALQRRGIEARVEDTPLPHFFRVRRALKGEPRVSVIVPFRDKPDLLRLCIESLLEKTTYSNWEVLGISNDSIGFRTIEEMERLRALDERVAFRELNEPFNFSRLVNFGAGHATGEHLVLLNNDIELVTPDWIEGLLEHSQRDEVAAVGAKLYYPNNRIQHAGLGIGLGGAAGHLHKNFRADSPGYFNRLNVIQNVSAVTGAMMMVAADKYRKLGGFDEEQFSVAYNDVDFCLRAREAGYLHVFTPFVEAYHHESLSRGYEDSAAKQQRFQRETENLRARHGEILERGDPYYNPNFDQGRDDFQLELPVL